MPFSDLWGDDLELDDATLAVRHTVEATSSTSSSASPQSHQSRLAPLPQQQQQLSGPSSIALVKARAGSLTPTNDDDEVEVGLGIGGSRPDPLVQRKSRVNALLQDQDRRALIDEDPIVDGVAAGPSAGEETSQQRIASFLAFPIPNLSPSRPSRQFDVLPSDPSMDALRRSLALNPLLSPHFAASGPSNSTPSAPASASDLNAAIEPSSSSFRPLTVFDSYFHTISTASSNSIVPPLDPNPTASTSASTLDKGKGKALLSSQPFNHASPSSSSFFTSPIVPATTTVDVNGKDKQKAIGFSEEDFECCVCSDLFVGASSLVPCGHSFCGKCIHEYLKAPGSSTCPVCRVTIPSYGTRVIPNYALDGLVSMWAEATLEEEAGKEWVSRKDGWLAYKLSIEDQIVAPPRSSLSFLASRYNADFPWIPPAGGIAAAVGQQGERLYEAMESIRRRAERDVLPRALPTGPSRRRRRETLFSSGEEDGDEDYRPPPPRAGPSASMRINRPSVFARRDEMFPPLPSASGSSSVSTRSRRVRAVDSPSPPSSLRSNATASFSRARRPSPTLADAGSPILRPVASIPSRTGLFGPRPSPPPPLVELSPRARRRRAVFGIEGDDGSDAPLAWRDPPPHPSAVAGPSRPSAAANLRGVLPECVHTSRDRIASGSGSRAANSTADAQRRAVDAAFELLRRPSSRGAPSPNPVGGSGGSSSALEGGSRPARGVGFARFGEGRPASLVPRVSPRRRRERKGDEEIEVVDLISD